MAGEGAEVLNIQFNEKQNFHATATEMLLLDWTVFVFPYEHQ